MNAIDSGLIAAVVMELAFLNPISFVVFLRSAGGHDDNQKRPLSS